MRPRHPALPALWLMTDERQGDGLWSALDKLPAGAGVVFRHHATSAAQRRALFQRVRDIARRKRLTLILAGPISSAIRWRAHGAHGRSPHRHTPSLLIRTAPAHNRPEIEAARRAGADLIFLSPVFPTRSHPGARTLSPIRFGLLARGAGIPVIALGGMKRDNVHRLARLGSSGWAAIDGLS